MSSRATRLSLTLRVLGIFLGGVGVGGIVSLQMKNPTPWQMNNSTIVWVVGLAGFAFGLYMLLRRPSRDGGGKGGRLWSKLIAVLVLFAVWGAAAVTLSANGFPPIHATAIPLFGFAIIASFAWMLFAENGNVWGLLIGIVVIVMLISFMDKRVQDAFDQRSSSQMPQLAPDQSSGTPTVGADSSSPSPIPRQPQTSTPPESKVTFSKDGNQVTITLLPFDRTEVNLPAGSWRVTQNEGALPWARFSNGNPSKAYNPGEKCHTGNSELVMPKGCLGDTIIKIDGVPRDFDEGDLVPAEKISVAHNYRKSDENKKLSAGKYFLREIVLQKEEWPSLSSAIPQLRPGHLANGLYAVKTIQPGRFEGTWGIAEIHIESVRLAATTSMVHFVALNRSDRVAHFPLIGRQYQAFMTDDQGQRYTMSKLSRGYGRLQLQTVGPGEAFRFEAVFDRLRGIPERITVVDGVCYLKAELVR